MKKLVSLATAALVLAATALPVFAASPSTSTVNQTPVTATAADLTAKGYTDVTPAELQATATTLEQAMALELSSVLDAITNVAEAPVAPNEISLAKLDIIKNPAVNRVVVRNGGLGLVVSSKSLTSTTGRRQSRTIRSVVAGTVPGDKVTLIYYIPGDPTPHTRTLTVAQSGKIIIRNLPIPCNYHLVR